MRNRNVNVAEMADPFSGLLLKKLDARSKWLAWLIKSYFSKTQVSELPSTPSPQLEPYIGFYEGNATIKGRALINYLTKPFYMDRESVYEQDYSNLGMSIEIAKIFNSFGYVVDIVDWKDSKFIPQSHYDVFLGMTKNFTNLIQYLSEDTLKIYFATRSFYKFEEASVNHRLQNLYDRNKIRLTEPATISENRDVFVPEVADAIIVLGNDTTVSTFSSHNKHTYSVPNPCTKLPPPLLKEKNFNTARRQFLYLASWNLVGKGLDMVLDAFAKMPDLHVWICAPLDSEPDFLKAYRKQLFKTPNVHPIGWVQMQSPEFLELTAKCAALIFPSCAEGMSGSVLNCMARGVIPIVTPESGVDVDDFGITLEECSPETISEAARIISNLSPDECLDMSQKSYRMATTQYTFCTFRDRFEQSLSSIFSQRIHDGL